MTENHTWKMPEWKWHTLENDRKIKFEKCQNGNCTPWKIPEWAMYNPEIDRKFRPWKMTENHAWKMPEWKLHTLENDIKITP